jgi:2-phospho-L-lactate guanylyltransferase
MVEGVHVLVPLKRLDGAKTRLAGLLSPEERAGLMRAMVADVLDAVRGIGPVTLVSSDPSAAGLARAHGAAIWDDTGLDWNEALAGATTACVRAPVVAIVSGDVPLLTRADVEALVAATPARGIAIARAVDGGTNAVTLRPPGVLVTCFGVPGSAARHAELAATAGLRSAIVDRSGTALDLDTPADVDSFLVEGRAGRTLGALAAALDGTAIAT